VPYHSDDGCYGGAAAREGRAPDVVHNQDPIVVYTLVAREGWLLEREEHRTSSITKIRS
jgi:hypothetical protein